MSEDSITPEQRIVVLGVGNRQETAETTGLAHLVEHAMFTGTPNVGVDEHERRVG